MKAAIPSAKMTVPVNLRYSFSGDPAAGAVTLNLAAIPRASGTNLNVSIKSEPGIEVTAAPLSIQKATQARVYRKSLALGLSPQVTRVRVLVTMDLPEGSGFGYYTIPLESGNISQKTDSPQER